MEMNTDILNVLFSSPVFSVVIVIVASALLNAIKQGAVSSIGKQGIIFNNKENADVKTIKSELEQIKQELITVKKYNKRLELALLRLQILSDELSLETKLSLYDEYKYLGGNSYIDLYISQLKEENKCGKI